MPIPWSVSLVGIYDADGTLVGELRYAAGKLLGREKCALCDITHGWNPMGSRRWKQACAVSDVELELVHRDEATDDQMAAASGLPSILRQRDGQWSEAMPAPEIAQFVGHPVAFLERLKHL